MPDKLYDTRTAASVLGIGARTLEKMRATGTGPEWVRLGCRGIRYRETALEAYLERRVHAADEAATA